MHFHNHPPMFTSHGYQPSIFMDTSPKYSCTERHYGPTTVSRDQSAPARRVDYIQIWLNTHPPEPVIETAPTSSYVASPAPTRIRDTAQGTGTAGRLYNPDSDDDSLEWESCVSSPITKSPHGSEIPPAEQVPAPFAAVAPVSLAFRQRSMIPRLPFRSRARCIFLAASLSADSRMHRRVKELLHNTSVQRIRAWFKTSIEPNALEQWRNLSLLSHLSNLAAAPGCAGSDPNTDTIGDDCPICFRSGYIMKTFVECRHMVCWKCEQDLDRAGNVSCPMCRRLRLSTTYQSVLDLFKTTIGLHPHDYIHAYCLPTSNCTPSTLERSENALSANQIDGEDAQEIEHELTDRYLWEHSASFLEHMQAAKRHPFTQYFQLNAAHDLCFKPSTERHLPEYNDRAVLEPPTSGLVLPPHRLYIALIHFCLDMLTLPNPTEFQLQQPRFKHEVLLIELVTLFLVPTDEFSPRGPDRIYNAPAWIEHGQYILARIHRFLQVKVRQYIRELDGDDVQSLNGREPLELHVQATSTNGAVPSIRVPRHILYLGTARWTWVAQSLTVLVTWLQAAQANPSMVAPVARWVGLSLLGKHELQQENFRPFKRQRVRRRVVEEGKNGE